MYDFVHQSTAVCVSTTMTQNRRDGRLNLCCYIQAPNVTWSYCHLTLSNSPSFLLLVTGSEEDETGIISEKRTEREGKGRARFDANKCLLSQLWPCFDNIVNNRRHHRFYYTGWLRDWKCSEKFWNLLFGWGKMIYTPAVVGILGKLIYDWEKSVCVIFREQRAR